MLADTRFQIWGHQLFKAPIGLPGLLASRPFFEGYIRAAVRELPNVSVRDGHSAAGLTTTADRRQITGVRVDGPTSETITADLVVDATGRGSRADVWLTELGYQAPAEERVQVGIGYSTRHYRLHPDALSGDALILSSGTPAIPPSRRWRR